MQALQPRGKARVGRPPTASQLSCIVGMQAVHVQLDFLLKQQRMHGDGAPLTTVLQAGSREQHQASLHRRGAPHAAYHQAGLVNC